MFRLPGGSAGSVSSDFLPVITGTTTAGTIPTTADEPLTPISSSGVTMTHGLQARNLERNKRAELFSF